MNLYLRRFELTRHKTVSKLFYGDVFICFVIEPPINRGAIPYGKQSHECLFNDTSKPCVSYSDTLEPIGENEATQLIKLLIADSNKKKYPQVIITRSF